MQVFNRKTGQKYFQKTRQRYDEPGHARELTFSCYQYYQFLSRDRVRVWFLDELEKARKHWAFDLWAYVLMPEHVHLLIHPHNPTLAVGRIAGRLKEAVARLAIDYIETHASHWLSRISVLEGQRTRRRFWQPGGGYDRNVVEPDTAHKMVEYIHANPVRRGLVKSAEDWEWSSARWYAGMRPVKIEMNGTLPMQYKVQH
jgi:putative transposase